MKLLNKKSVCYCVGVGEDISFDLGLIDHIGCHVYAYDPTPRAIAHVETRAGDNERYHFFPIGLWDSRATIKFYAPLDPNYVSHSAVLINQTEIFFEAQCDRLRALMDANGHATIDLLKIDIEGAEYRVLDSIIADQLEISILCIEYDEALLSDGKWRIRESVEKLRDVGYVMISADPQNRGNYTFVRPDLLTP